MEQKGLTDKQQRFCQEYLVDLNATQAAIRAGYAENSADVEGSRLLVNAKVSEEVQRLMKERSDRTQITADRVLKEVANIAFSNMRDFLEFDDSGIRFKNSEDLTDEQMALIGEVSQTRGKYGTNIKFKTQCKDVALYNLMRHLGLFEKDNEQSKAQPVFQAEVKILPAGAAIVSSEKDVELD